MIQPGLWTWPGSMRRGLVAYTCSPGAGGIGRGLGFGWHALIPFYGQGELETRVLTPWSCRKQKSYLKEITCVDYTNTDSAFSGKQFQNHFILHLHLANGLIIATLITFKQS